MKNCNEYLELISAAMDGALSPQEQARLDAHLTQCPDCKALYDDLKTIHQALRELPPVEVPAGLTDRILEAVAADNVVALPKPKKSSFQWKRGLATAAVFALVLLGMGTLRGQLNATKSAAPEGFMPRSYRNETDEAAPAMTDRTSEGALNEEVQAPAQDYQEPSASADRMTNAAPPVEDATAQGAAKQSPASSPEVQTTGAQAPEPQPTEPPTGSEADPEVTSFTVGDITDITEDVIDPEATVNITGSLFVIPLPEGVDMEIPGEGDPDEEEAPMAAMEPGEALSLTREEALSLLVEFLWPEGIREDMQSVDTEEFFGYATPLAPVDGDPHTRQQVSLQLEYCRLTPNGKYHEFWLHSFLLDDPETGLAHSSTLNFFAVPLDRGEILTQRVEIPDNSDESMALYLAGIDAYNEAICH